MAVTNTHTHTRTHMHACKQANTHCHTQVNCNWLKVNSQVNLQNNDQEADKFTKIHNQQI